MNLDRLIDETFPSLAPDPRGRSSDPVSPLRERQTTAATYAEEYTRQTYGQGCERGRAALIPRSAKSVETEAFRGLNKPLQLASTNPPSVSPSSSPSGSKLRSFFRSSSRTTSDDASARPLSTDRANHPTSSARARTNSTYSSNLALSPAARHVSLPFSSGPEHVGQSPSSRPSTPGTISSTPNRGPRKKNLSIWSLSPSILGGGGRQGTTRDSEASTGCEDADVPRFASSSSIHSRSRSRQESFYSETSPSARTSPARSLSCLAAVAPPSPPLDPTVFVPPSRANVASSSSRPATPRRTKSRFGLRTSGSDVATNRVRSESTSTVSSRYPESVERTGSTPHSHSLKKSLSTLLLNGSDRSSSPSGGPANDDRTLATTTRRRRKRTTSKGGGGLFGGASEGAEGADGDELTEEELKSWRLSSGRQRMGMTSGSSSSMEKLGFYDPNDGRRRRTSSNRSFLDGPEFAFGSSTGTREDSASDDEDEVLIIDRTKSKGFSTLLGDSYETFYSTSFQTPTATSFTFTQLPVSTTFPPTLLDTVEICPATPPPAVSTGLRTPAITSPRSANRLSQMSTNSDEALWLDAAATNSFPSSPLPPPSSSLAPASKPVKQSAFSSSLVHPTPPPSTPGSPHVTTTRRTSLIPLSPRVAQEQGQGQARRLSEAETGKDCPPSPPDSDPERTRAQVDEIRSRQVRAAVEGLMINWSR